MKSMEAVKDNVSLENDLAHNELLKRDLNKVIGIITPNIPLVGLLLVKWRSYRWSACDGKKVFKGGPKC